MPPRNVSVLYSHDRPTHLLSLPAASRRNSSAVLSRAMCSQHLYTHTGSHPDPIYNPDKTRPKTLAQTLISVLIPSQGGGSPAHLLAAGAVLEVLHPVLAPLLVAAALHQPLRPLQTLRHTNSRVLAGRLRQRGHQAATAYPHAVASPRYSDDAVVCCGDCSVGIRAARSGNE